MAATARIELGGVQVICRQAKTRLELAGVQVICRRPKTLIHLAGVQVIASPLYYEEEAPVFPTTLAGYWPERVDYPQALVVDSTMRSGLDGRPLSRSGDSQMLRSWAFLLRHLTLEQRDELWDFQEEVGYGADPFHWTDVRTNETYLVQFAEPIVFDLDDDGCTYRCEVRLTEWDGEL